METLLKDNPFILLKIPGCVNCKKLIHLFESIGLQSKFVVINIAELSDINYEEMVNFLENKTDDNQFPMVFINGQYIGSYKEIVEKITFATFHDLLENELNIRIEVDV